jgi:flavorubredoxin
MSINFSQNNMNYLLQFLRFIRGREGLYLELIYDEDTSEILYASQYYITQKMNKSIGKEFKKERRERSYSDDENMILNTIKKN